VRNIEGKLHTVRVAQTELIKAAEIRANASLLQVH
jgi:uncharacterized protein Usg